MEDIPRRARRIHGDAAHTNNSLASPTTTLEAGQRMIIRISEAQVMPDRVEAFIDQLRTLVASFPTRYEGLLSHEILVGIDDPTRIQYVSRWTDQTALIAYAGENWARDPVTFPNEDRFLAAPLTLRHFTASPISSDGVRHSSKA